MTGNVLTRSDQANLRVGSVHCVACRSGLWGNVVQVALLAVIMESRARIAAKINGGFGWTAGRRTGAAAHHRLTELRGASGFKAAVPAQYQ
ncbi:hypothetical protein BA177_03245 [Woeseia oceani]|uniref:Uncharacterized protein n=1 Tax=Woeseia oceani TaxID=1548547 RepID=A0A193LD45_9GAMM|nr:hypothetical protein BA177_03245 [Woeseia oceani]